MIEETKVKFLNKTFKRLDGVSIIVCEELAENKVIVRNMLTKIRYTIDRDKLINEYKEVIP
jgi:histidyl-tRNA synthetase